MKLSEFGEYKKYMFSLIEKDYTQAEQALQLCIDAAEKDNDKGTLMLLMQNFGTLNFLKGDVEQAIKIYLESEKITDYELLAKYNFAKFLADKVGNYEQAAEKAEEIIRIALSSPWAKTDSDASSEHYLAQCYALQGYCYARLNEYEKAAQKLMHLLDLEKEVEIDYTVDLCALLIANGSNILESKNMLKKLLEGAELKLYPALISRIEDILNQ